MDFLEAVKAMKEGKKVKYNQAYYYLESGWIIRDFKGEKTQLFRDTMMTNFIWEIVEEKTLSDKKQLEHEDSGAMIYKEKDVKEAIKELKSRADIDCTNSWLIKEKDIKEIFGERLLEVK